MGRRPIDPDKLAMACATVTIGSLHDFAKLIIAHVYSGRTLDDEALASIRDKCVRGVKSADPVGFSIKQEAEILGQIVENVEKLIDSAILQGRERQER